MKPTKVEKFTDNIFRTRVNEDITIDKLTHETKSHRCIFRDYSKDHNIVYGKDRNESIQVRQFMLFKPSTTARCVQRVFNLGNKQQHVAPICQCGQKRLVF